MVGRFGWPGLLAHRLARGLDDRPIQARPADEDAGVEAEIDPPAERIETVAFAARALADDMVGRLARDGLDCVSVGIEAESDSGHASRRRWRHELPLRRRGRRRPGALAARGLVPVTRSSDGPSNAHPDHAPSGGARRRPSTRNVGREEPRRRASRPGAGPGAGPPGPRSRDRPPPVQRPPPRRHRPPGAAARSRRQQALPRPRPLCDLQEQTGKSSQDRSHGPQASQEHQDRQGDQEGRRGGRTVAGSPAVASARGGAGPPRAGHSHRPGRAPPSPSAAGARPAPRRSDSRIRRAAAERSSPGPGRGRWTSAGGARPPAAARPAFNLSSKTARPTSAS